MPEKEYKKPGTGKIKVGGKSGTLELRLRLLRLL